MSREAESNSDHTDNVLTRSAVMNHSFTDDTGESSDCCHNSVSSHPGNPIGDLTRDMEESDLESDPTQLDGDAEPIENLINALTRGAELTLKSEPSKSRLFLRGIRLLVKKSGINRASSVSFFIMFFLLFGSLASVIAPVEVGGRSGADTIDTAIPTITPGAINSEDFSIGARSANLTTTTTPEIITVWTEEYSIRVDHTTSFVDYTIRPYQTTDYVRYKRMNPQYAGEGTVDELGNALDAVSMTISNWGRTGQNVWFLESCPEFSLNQSFEIYRDYFELNVKYTPGTKKVSTVYSIALYSQEGTIYSMIEGGRHHRYVPGYDWNTAAGTGMGGWYPRYQFFAPACDMRASSGNLGVEWGYNEPVAYIYSPIWMKDYGIGGASAFGLKFTSLNSVVPNIGLGTSETFHMFVRPYKFTDDEERGYDVGYAQWVSQKIAATYGNHNQPIFPLVIMDTGTWTQEFRNWVQNSQVTVATYSENPDQINWNYKSAQMAGYQPDTPSDVPTSWQIYNKGNVPLTTSDGSAICSAVSGPYSTPNTYRWHLIQNDSYMSWWTGSRGVFWDEMNSNDAYNKPRNDYKNRSQFIYEGYLDLVKESYQAGYWDYVITNPYTAQLHLAIASDLSVIESYEPSSAYGVDFTAHVHSTMNFVKNIPSQYRPKILVYQYYDATDNWKDQNDVYSALFGSAKYGFCVTLLSYSNYASQMHNLLMAEDMFKAMGYTRHSDNGIEIGTLDLTSEGSSLTTSARMVVTNGSGTPTVTFTALCNNYTITNLNGSANNFNFVIPSDYYYDAGVDAQKTTPMTFTTDGKGTFHGKVLAEKTGKVVKRSELRVNHAGSGSVAVNLLSSSSNGAELAIGANGGTTTISMGGLVAGQTYGVYINSQFAENKIADSQGFITFSQAYGSSDAVAIRQGAGVDTTPPSIISAIPSNGATGVEPTQHVTITFSEAMNETATKSAFSMSQGGAPVAGSVTWQAGDTIMVFSPSQVFDYGTRYFANVSTGASDVAGNQLQSQFSIGFTTKSTNDTVPPNVTDVYPSSGATGVSTRLTVVVTFSEMMDVSTTSSSIHLSSTEGVVNGDLHWMDFNTTALFIPSTDLFSSKKYTITVEESAKDLFGNNMTGRFTSTFVTKVNDTDTTKPTVQSTVPIGGSTGVEITQNVAVFFSEKMNKTSVEAAFSIQNGALGVGGSLSWDSQGTSCVFTPYGALGYSSTYIVNIGATAKDVAGNTMAAAYSLSFTTKSSNDVLAPTVTGVYPSNAVTGVSTYVTIVVAFSEWMNNSATANAFHLSSTSGDVSGTVEWTSKNTTLIFTPSRSLVPSTEYTVSVRTSASDLIGNHLASEFESTFVTRNDGVDTSAPIIEHVQSGNAEVGSAFQLTANVTDVSKIAGVSIEYVDVTGAYHSIAMGLGLSFFDATIPAQTAPGTIRYTIQAQDEFGNVATSTEYALRVLDTTPPSTRIVSPSPGTTVSALINIETVATDNYGISSVEFLIDQEAVANDTNEPYVFMINPIQLSEGNHTVTVTAYDLVGLSASDSIEITIHNIDMTSPSILTVYPSNDMVDVGTTPQIAIEFSEEMDHPSTVSAISLEGSGAVVELCITWQNDTTVTTVPQTRLQYATTYWLNVSATAMDVSGNQLTSVWSSLFVTMADPSIKNQIILMCHPSDGSDEVPVDTTILVIFKEAMNHTSVESGFSLRGGDRLLAGSYRWSSDSTQLEFYPSTRLFFNTSYNFILVAGVKSLQDNKLENEWRVEFTTQLSGRPSTISGFVMDENMPIAGVLVTDGYRTTMTDEGGEFVLWEVPSGSYSISAYKWNFSCPTLIRVYLDEGQEISGLWFTMSRSPGTSTITGVVLSTTNTVIDEALVVLEETGQSALTDVNGRFILTHVLPGEYSINVTKLSYVSQLIESVRIGQYENLKPITVSLASDSGMISTDTTNSEFVILEYAAIPVVLGAGIVALIGGMMIKGSRRSNKKGLLGTARILEGATDQMEDENILTDKIVIRARQNDAPVDKDSNILDSLVTTLCADPPPKSRIKSTIDAKGGEDFERGLKELQKLL